MKGLGGDCLYACTPCTVSIKNDTEIFNVVFKGNVPSFEFKLNFDRSSSMGEIDGLCFIFIDV
jgi:hypothetical protein